MISSMHDIFTTMTTVRLATMFVLMTIDERVMSVLAHTGNDCISNAMHTCILTQILLLLPSVISPEFLTLSVKNQISNVKSFPNLPRIRDELQK